MMSIQIVSVDLQHDFAAEGGVLYRPRPCVPFIQRTLLPYVREHALPIAEIISDYRAVEPASESTCVPGEWGYQSLIPAELRHPSVWVKAEPSPAWTRKGAGRADQLAGPPYPAPEAFSAWLAATLGPPDPDLQIVLIGLMFEICVFSTLQELHYRGYRARILFEGVDTYSGDAEQKRLLAETLAPFWGQTISWSELQQTIQPETLLSE